MYNGIGLQTARGSGTNGYVQTNKFFVRPRTGGKPVNGGKGFEDDQGTAGLSKKPNKDILEHDRKRQIHLKLAILEDKLADQGYSDAEIAQKLEEARLNLEAAGSEESDAPGNSKISDTQTHQVAARKEKQMETFRAALGLPDQQQPEEGIIDDEPTGDAYEGGVGRLKERREHSFLDRGSGRKLDVDIDGKDGKGKENLRGGDDDIDEVKRHKKNESKKRWHDDSSESDKHGRDRRRRSKKKAKGSKRKQVTDSESDSSSSDSDSISDSDSGEKRRRKTTKKRSRSKRSVSSESEEVGSDNSTKLRKSHKKTRPSYRSGSKEVRVKHDEHRRVERKRHDSDVSESGSEDDKQQLRKREEAYRGGQKQKRDVESDHLRDRNRDNSGDKRAARDSDDSEPKYENKKQLRSVIESYSGGMMQRRDEEAAISKHRSKKVASDSDDSETEIENKRQLKDESYQKGRKHKREEDEDHNNHGRDRYRGDGDDGYKKHNMDDRYRGGAIEEDDNDDRQHDDAYKHDRGRYRQRRETVKEGDDDYKHGREDRLRGDASAGKRGATDEDDERIRREREYSNKGRSHYDGRSSEKRSSYGNRA